MPDRTDSIRQTRAPRVRLLVVLAVAIGSVVAGCGGSSPRSTTMTTSGVSVPAARSGSAAPGTSHARVLLALAKCMRANGVPNFPDPRGNGSSVVGIQPGPNGGETINGVAVNGPAFQTAQAKCQKDTPQAPTMSRSQAANTLTQALKFAQCLRSHGIENYPDPQISTVPGSNGFLVHPGYRGGLAGLASLGINSNSPVFQSALRTCGGVRGARVGGFGAH